MRETWFELEDGNVVHPNECTYDDKGTLRHKGGVAVAMRGDVHRSRGVDVEAMRAKAREMTADGEKPVGQDREMKPAGGGKTYRTRTGKGE